MPKKKSKKTQFKLKSKATMLILITVINILVIGFILGALSGDIKNVEENVKLPLLLIICMTPLIILGLVKFTNTVSKVAVSIFILIYAVLGVTFVALTKPTVDIRAQILGFMALLFMAFNWIFLHWKMCSLCGS